MASDVPLGRSLRRVPGLLALLAALAALTVGRPAVAAPGDPAGTAGPTAADKETARSLMDRGDDRSEARDFAGALKAYQGADAIMHLPMTGAAVARAQEALGLWLEARDTALAVLRLPVLPGENAAYARARTEASTIAARLGPRIPALGIQLAAPPPGVVVTVDGEPVPAAALDAPRKVNPGRHVITASAPGFAGARVEITVAAGPEGTVVPVPLSLSPASPGTAPPGTASAGPVPGPLPSPLPPGPVAPGPSGPSGPSRISPLVLGGFVPGGVGLLVAAVTGGLSLAATSKLGSTDHCDATTKLCPPSAQSDLHSANVLANVANVSLGVGIAGVALGVVGIVVSPRGAAPSTTGRTLEPVIGPGSAGVRGTF